MSQSITDRSRRSLKFRKFIAERDRNMFHDAHVPNSDEMHYSGQRLAGIMNFTKGLEHNDFGQVDSDEFKIFRAAINKGEIGDFAGIPVSTKKVRKWEAPTAGFVMDPQGPDAQARTMPPAPALNPIDGTFDELVFEMAEVYELALLRDVSFAGFSAETSKASVSTATERLSKLKYANGIAPFAGRPRKIDNGILTNGTVFRSSNFGADIGPYLSCFMLMGSGDVEKGEIAYGNQTIDQRVAEVKKQDYMVCQTDWLDVQNGAKRPKFSTLFNGAKRRFIHTPRDLATYVHDDALYQAYLNATLILLGMEAPLDEAFKKYWGGPNTTGFALWGGPHILSLVTEVATRALKAVRWQKFKVHLRVRPEALAGRVVHAEHFGGDFANLRSALGSELLNAVSTHNVKMGGEGEPWLPMAFQEGSPMHPSYGAGHATVAGACVTVLKAFFNTTAELREYNKSVSFRTDGKGQAVEIVTTTDGAKLCVQKTDVPLTLLGELNKLAANISIGRNMAGVHFFSDYFDSESMGEEIADGIMRDQADGYNEDFEMTYVPFGEQPNLDHKNTRIVRDPIPLTS